LTPEFIEDITDINAKLFYVKINTNIFASIYGQISTSAGRCQSGGEWAMPDDSNSGGPEYILDPSRSLDFTAILDKLSPDLPSGRPLTSGEIALLRSVFGNSIDYTQVRIRNEAYFPLLSDTLMTAVDGHIYFPGSTYSDDFSTLPPGEVGDFFHEMTHIWQEQHGVNVGFEALIGLFAGGGDYNKLYPYLLEPGRNFQDYNIEQQGEIVEDYFVAANGIYEPENASVETYRDVLPFDQQGGERVVPFANYGPPDGLEATPDLGPEPQTPSAPAPQATPKAPDAGSNDPGVSALPNVEPANVEPGDATSATPTQPGPSPEPAPKPHAKPPVPQAEPQGPTLAEPLGDDDDVDPNEEGAVTEGEGDDQGTGGAGNEDDNDDEQGTGGAGGQMPNPMDDGPSYTNGDYIQLLTRNAPYVNPGPGGIDMAIVGDIDPSVLLTRNAPYVNPGPGDFDMPAGSSDYTVLLNRMCLMSILGYSISTCLSAMPIHPCC
jgi:hypothetical protein